MANNSLPSRSKNETAKSNGLNMSKNTKRIMSGNLKALRNREQEIRTRFARFAAATSISLTAGATTLTKKHANAATAAAAQPSMSPFVSPDRSLAVTRAELLFTSFLVEHNIAFGAKSATYQTLLDGSAEVQSPE